jgi:hypothetical protein
MKVTLARMPPRSLPERTVDAWVSTVVCRVFPNARIWGPTQVLEDTNWDYGVSLGDGKIFIMEDKATSPIERVRKAPLHTHRIEINRTQLAWYCDDVEPDLQVPVFYVLPAPPWQGAQTGSVVVPDQAICRTASPSGPFENWAFVARAADLRNYLGVRASLDTDELPLPTSISLEAFLDDVRSCRLGRRVTGTGEGATQALKGADQVGADDAIPASRSGRGLDRIEELTGSALAVFGPASDIPGW